MHRAREHARRRLGIDSEREIFEAHGDEEDKYIHNYMQRRFECTKLAGMCKFCKQKSVFIELRQDRSGDEGMTAHATCTNAKCRKTWTVY